MGWVQSGGSHGQPGVVGRPSRCAGSSQKSLPEGREALSEGREWSEDPPRGSGALPEVLEWSVGFPRGLGVVGRQSWRAGSGQEAITDGR